MKLQKLLKKQLLLAIWQTVMFVGMLVSFIILIVTIVGSIPTSDSHASEFESSARNIFGTLIVCSLIIFLLGIPLLVLWILGIINAISIHAITDDSSILIVFSILTFGFIHLIIAFIQKNKFNNYDQENIQVSNNHLQQKNDDFNVKKTHLDKALINGIISSKEYEIKMKELKG